MLRRLKHTSLIAQYPAIELSYSQSDPVVAPITLTLAGNGLRLRFDGPEQRLRLIEVIDFRKVHAEYEGMDVFKSHEAEQSGPSYRSLIKLFGPTFPGEHLDEPQSESNATYVLSYPGVAFSFSVSRTALESGKDNQTLLSSSAASPAQSMAIYLGESWPKARAVLFAPSTAPPRPRAVSSVRRPDTTDEVELVKVYGEGRLELVRRSGQALVVTLSETTPQDLVTELGPPDAIYRKNDRRLAIHKNRGHTRGRSSSADTDYSSSRTTEDDSEGEDMHDPALSAEARELGSAEHFFNYSRYGFDFLISQATTPSAASPTLPEAMTSVGGGGEAHRVRRSEQTATKLIIHGNVPASWLFGRNRRCRWSLEHVPTARETQPLTSELRFADVAVRLAEVFGTADLSGSVMGPQKGMLLNRGWADSPSSSCELLGGWEEDTGSKAKAGHSMHSQKDQGVSSTSELFGYPGMIFEVLPNDCINGLTVY